MPKRRPTGGADTIGQDDKQDDVKPSLKRRRKKSNLDDPITTIWIDDDTLKSSQDSETKDVILNITLVPTNSVAEDDDSSYYPSDHEPSKDETEFIGYVLEKYLGMENQPTGSPKVPLRRSKRLNEKPPIKLTKKEEEYYNSQPDSNRTELFELMKRVSALMLDEGTIPNKFKVLQLPISDYMKSIVIRKLNLLEDLSPDTGEWSKLKTWIDAFLRIPFGKVVPLPVTIKDGSEQCKEFLKHAIQTMDKNIYGMQSAKLQIMQIIAQWIVNPSSIGNVIALSGPPGIGKTSFAKNVIANVLKRPFEFFTLGGASDISTYIGHSYTYEGSLWGRIVDSILHAGTMNPVMYFDELDKISSTPHGEEVVNMMIHITDRTQNSQFHDRYFAGVEFDLSQCLFVFSLNDIDKVHPILRDRMTIIECDGYNESDKKVITTDYVLPQLYEKLKFDTKELVFTDSCISYMIKEFSNDEKGVRNLIRSFEIAMTRLNMLRIGDSVSLKNYDFYFEANFPLTIDQTLIKKLLFDFNKKEPEVWKSLYV
jgi:ATP-dependent Lon protease